MLIYRFGTVGIDSYFNRPIQPHHQESYMRYFRHVAKSIAQAELFANLLVKCGPSTPSLVTYICTSMSENCNQDVNQKARIVQTAQDILDAFVQAGAINYPYNWDEVPEDMRERLARTADHSAQSSVIVRATGQSGFRISIDMVCRSTGDTWGHGVALEASYNSMTAFGGVTDLSLATLDGTVMSKAKNVPAQIADMYTKFKELEKLGFTRVTLR
ncbi:MAG: hypothetical protein IPJ68_02255 [Candidatus Moraniibacteriota bacterium]|nr:MAG: hypothetical protein IPJ68_02255 [Candidatus Moranbacteria bacterium]